MTEEQKRTIMHLRNMGSGYRKIGIALDIQRDNVRNYCKTKGIDGYAKRLIENKEWKQMEKECQEAECRQCGNPIEIKPDGRRRVYCSDKCRSELRKSIPLFISMNACFVVKSLKTALESKNFLAGIVMCGTGSGGRRIQKKL